MFVCQCTRCSEKFDGEIFMVTISRVHRTPFKTVPLYFSGFPTTVETTEILCEQCAATIAEVLDNDSIK